MATPPLPRSPASILAALLLLLPACGGGDEPALRIVVEAWAVDGVLPAELEAVPIGADTAGGSEPRFPLRRVPGGDGTTYEVVGGGEGYYRVEAPGGDWWMISAGGPPEVRRDRLAPRVRLGRARTVYVTPPSVQAHVGPRWAAARLGEAGEREAVPLEVEHEPPGYAAALRVAEADWYGRIEIVGELVAGAPADGGQPGALVALTEPFPFEASPDGHPLLVPLRVTPSTPLDVRVVPPTPGGAVDGTVVRIRVLDVPIEYELRQRVKDGLAVFSAVPAMDRPLALSVGEGASGARSVVAPDDLRLVAEVSVLGPGPTQGVALPLGPGVAVDHGLARVPGLLDMPRVRLHAEGDSLVIDAPLGDAVHLLLRRGDGWAELHGVPDEPLAAASFAPGVRVSGRVEGSAGATAVRFRLLDGDEAVVVDGLTFRVSPYGTYEGLLPPGRYRVEVLAGRQGFPRAAPLDATTPGGTIHLPLRAGP